MKNIFLNIHGFGSSGKNSKAAALAGSFPDYELISPDFPADPEECLNILENIIAENSKRPLIMQGSSMGGLYAMIMHIRHGIPAILINPALAPSSLVEKRVGEVYDFGNGKTILITAAHVEKFAAVEAEIKKAICDGFAAKGKVMALLGEFDEVLDQTEMKKILEKLSAEIIMFKTDHHFDGYDKIIETNSQIRNFLLKN